MKIADDVRSYHVTDVGGTCWVGKYSRPESLGSQSLPYGQGENIDHFVRVRTDEMRSQHPVGFLSYQYLEPVGRLGNAEGGVPVGRLSRFDAELKPALMRFRLA